MKVALYTRLVKDKHKDYITSLFNFLHAEGIDYIKSENLRDFDTHKSDDTVYKTSTDVSDYNPDLIISLGGDGTILDTVLITKGTQIPVLGVNLGRLGFLSAANPEESYAAILNFKNNQGKVNIEKRMLLEVNGTPQIFENENVALNDLTFLRSNSSSMIEVTVHVDNEYLTTYNADGLIVSTSTGSTGYSLSCGGPVINPHTDLFAITPIAPHNLSIRPIVLPSDVTLKFEVQGRTPDFLCTMDSRLTHITPKHKIIVKKSANYFYLYQPNKNNFLEALKNKLHWGKNSFY